MLSQKDYEAFHAVVHSSRLSSDEFEIGTVDYVDRLERLYPDFTRVSIVYKPTRVMKNYVAGCLSYWICMFEQDVEGGAFKVI
ncbi:hypothetical protein [Geotalea toluenoxydans]|uniref:hypothetical protein n=1 Tax=Geotalea toluenoxydans TaxID=421624 RepID=UPI0006D07F9D|nr:hypothetical protein [Geotalea toluenoxydans]